MTVNVNTGDAESSNQTLLAKPPNCAAAGPCSLLHVRRRAQQQHLRHIAVAPPYQPPLKSLCNAGTQGSRPAAPCQPQGLWPRLASLRQAGGIGIPCSARPSPVLGYLISKCADAWLGLRSMGLHALPSHRRFVVWRASCSQRVQSSSSVLGCSSGSIACLFDPIC